MFVFARGYLVAGRAIDSQDMAGAAQVVVVNQTVANHFFPHGDALGRHITVDNVNGDWEVVGIVRDGKYNSPRETPQSMVFLPLLQLSGKNLYASCLLLRTTGDPLQVAGELDGPQQVERLRARERARSTGSQALAGDRYPVRGQRAT